MKPKHLQPLVAALEQASDSLSRIDATSATEALRHRLVEAHIRSQSLLMTILAIQKSLEPSRAVEHPDEQMAGTLH
jgi:hypothetical protein